jgi:hypothetical protein
VEPPILIDGAVLGQVGNGTNGGKTILPNGRFAICGRIGRRICRVSLTSCDRDRQRTRDSPHAQPIGKITSIHCSAPLLMMGSVIQSQISDQKLSALPLFYAVLCGDPDLFGVTESTR